MDPETVILSKICQAEKDKNYMTLLGGGHLKNNANESIYKTEIDSGTENKLIVMKGEGERN